MYVKHQQLSASYYTWSGSRRITDPLQIEILLLFYFVFLFFSIRFRGVGSVLCLGSNINDVIYIIKSPSNGGVIPGNSNRPNGAFLLASVTFSSSFF